MHGSDNDDDWRHNNLTKSLKARVRGYNVVEMLRLAKIVLENKPFPNPIKMYVTEPSKLKSHSPFSIPSSSEDEDLFGKGRKSTTR